VAYSWELLVSGTPEYWNLMESPEIDLSDREINA
jgi:hypothetical protein